MMPGSAISPMPDAVMMRMAAVALGVPEAAAATPRILLDAAIRWLASDDAQSDDGVVDGAHSSIFGATYRPAVDAVETAFAAFGLPTFEPDYSEWLAGVGGGDAMANGDALTTGDARALGNYLQTVQRGERFCTGYLGSMIQGGGMLRAARLLAAMLDNGEWTPRWT